MRKFLLLLMVLISYSSLFGQAGQHDPSFNPIPDIPAFVAGELATGSVTKYVKQSDGKIIAIGTFAGAIRRFNTDGTVDASFVGPSITGGFIKDIALFFNDQAMVVGNMVTSNTGNHYLALLNLNGTVATAFPKYVPAGNIDHVSVNANGSTVMIAGGFSDLSINNGAFQPRMRFALVGIDGTFFSNNPGINGTINQVFKDAQGRHVFVGDFTTFNGQSYPRIFRLNNNFSLDETFTVGSGFTGAAYAVTQQVDGKYLIGGDMTAYNGQACQRLVRLNEDGTLDDTFAPSTFDNRVLAVAASASGKVFVGGSFINYNGVNQYRLVGLNADGSLNPTFSVATALNGNVNALLAMPGERVLVAGAFDNFKGATRRNPLLLNQYGNRVSHNEAGISGGTIVRMAEQTDGKIIIGGSFTDYRGVPINGLARINADGTLDNSFNIGSGFSNSVNAIAIQSDGKILVGGSFAMFNGQAQLRLVRLNADGSKDDSFTPVSLNNEVIDIKIDTSNDKIYVSGGFGMTGGNGFTRLNSDGTKDADFNTPGGANNAVTRIHLYDDGKILLSGLFSSFNGNATVGKLVRLNADGTVDTSLSTSVGGVGFDTYSVSTMVVQEDGKIIVGGNWPYYQRAGVLTYSKALMRLNADGSYDNTFLYNNGFNTNASVSDIVIHPTGQIAVSGNFVNYGATAVNHLAYFEPNGTFISSAINGTNFSSSVSDLLLLNDGKLLASGGFANYNGKAHHGIVLLENPCSESSQQSLSICQGDEYTFGSQTLTATGIFTEVFSNQFSCDSTVTLTLSIIPTQFTMNMERCEFETLVINGDSISSYGDFEFIIPRAGTCDSVLTVTVSPKAADELMVDASICEGESYVYSVMAWNENDEFVEFNSDTITTAGVYNFSLRLGENGCETNVTVNLNVNPVYNIEAEDTFCPGEGFVFGDETLTQAGVYTKLFASASGCDSTVVLTLNPLEADIAYDEINQRITASTDYPSYRLFKNDSLVASGASGTIDYPVTECGDYQAIFGGEAPACNMGINITKSGANCQAAINVAVSNATLPLQVNVSFTGNSTGNNSVQNNLNFSFAGACPSVYTIRITDAAGCQKSLTIDYNTADLFWQLLPLSASCEVYSQVLPVNFQQVDSIQASICEGQVFSFGEQNLTEAGVYEAQFISTTGCDSTAILTLNVTPNPVITLAYDSLTKRLSATNAEYNSYKLFKDDIVVSSSASSSTIDYLADDCGEYRAEFGTVSCNISVTGNRTGSGACNYRYNLNVTNAVLPITWNAKTYLFNSFFGSTTLEQDISGTSNSSSFTISNACFRTYSVITILDANGCTQEVQVSQTNAGNFGTDGGVATFPTCVPTTNTVNVQNPQFEQKSLGLCASETYQFGAQLISESGIYTESFTTASNCDSTVVLTVTKFDELNIVTQPQSATLCESSSITLSIEATGKDLTYLWYKNGSDISGGINSSILLQNLTANDAAEYSVLVMDGCGNSQLSEIATLAVSAPPTINQQPSSLAICEGEEATFSIEVAGENAANFQWKKDGVNIEGATDTVLTITNVTPADMGNYSVEFTEDCGLASSAIATLTVNMAAIITQQPSGFTICEGDNSASMEVVATGDNLSYQWFFMGDSIGGAITNTLVFESFNLENSGDYSVKVAGVCGEAVTSQIATVEIQSLVSIQQNPAPVAICVDEDINLSVVASGSGTLTYQWKKNGNDIANATESTFNISNASAADAGNYSVEVLGTCGSVETQAVSVSVSDNRITITAQPASQVLCEGDIYHNNVISTGPVTAYQWYKDGVLIPGATTSTYTINGATAANAGAYTVQFIGGCNSPMSEVATVVVNPRPVIYEQPSVQYFCSGNNVVITPNIKLNEEFTYNWLRNVTGHPLYSSSTTTADLVIENFQSANQGSYILEIVSVNCGTLTANPQVVILAEQPLAMPSQSQELCESQSFTLNAVENSNTQIFSYQWKKDGVDIPGATDYFYTVNASSLSDGGSYTATVTAQCDTINTPASVIVINSGTSIDLTAEICKGESFEYNGSVFTEAGNYQVAFQNENGCNSVANIQLSVVEINTTLTLNGTILTAAQAGAAYQWVDCTNDMIIEGATNRTYEATASGSYAVRITLNGCEEFSECTTVNILGLDGFAHELSYYPNPVDNSLTVRFAEKQPESQFYMMSVDGKVISTQSFEGQEVQINTENLKSGIYFLRVQNEKGTSLMKIMKK